MARRRYEDRYRVGGEDRWERDRAHDRGYMERAGDELRSWFGDEEAERRRREDQERDRQWQREREMRDRGERDWSERSRWSDRDQDRGSSMREREDYRGRDRGDWTSRDRDDWATRGRSDWGSYGREDDWRDRSGSWDRNRGMYDYREQPYGGRESWTSRDRDWDDRSYGARSSERGWSTDEGRAAFRDPGNVFGYRYAGRTSDWDRSRSQDFRGRGPKGYQRSDSRIHEDVCERLSQGDVDAENIEVSVSNGEVTLSGSVHDRWDKRRAEDLVENLSGVRDVHNNIRVQREDKDRGIGMSDKTSSEQPGSVLGTTDRGRTTTTGPATTQGTRRTL